MTKRPFKEGLFVEVDGKPCLIGCRCQTCGQVFFPAKTFCLKCQSLNVQPLNLSRQGDLYTFTTVYMASEHFQPPYNVGWIELPEGLRVFSQIRGWQIQPLKIGMRMQLYIETLWQEGENEITGYVFRPANLAEAGRIQ